MRHSKRLSPPSLGNENGLRLIRLKSPSGLSSRDGTYDELINAGGRYAWG
jgi:hypothetical protein